MAGDECQARCVYIHTHTQPTLVGEDVEKASVLCVEFDVTHASADVIACEDELLHLRALVVCHLIYINNMSKGVEE
jgi:hypothetical protein